MRIDLSRLHKSIATLTTEDLPDFAVLIGRNGVGKTQILDALRQGEATVSDVSENEVEMYDMTSFSVPNTNQGNRGSDQFARNAANAYLPQQSGQSLVGAQQRRSSTNMLKMLKTTSVSKPAATSSRD